MNLQEQLFVMQCYFTTIDPSTLIDHQKFQSLVKPLYTTVKAVNSSNRHLLRQIHILNRIQQFNAFNHRFLE
jgi:hypothetical protein